MGCGNMSCLVPSTRPGITSCGGQQSKLASKIVECTLPALMVIERTESCADEAN